jgi:hypothetical protein
MSALDKPERQQRLQALLYPRTNAYRDPRCIQVAHLFSNKHHVIPLPDSLAPTILYMAGLIRKPTEFRRPLALCASSQIEKKFAIEEVKIHREFAHHLPDDIASTTQDIQTAILASLKMDVPKNEGAAEATAATKEVKIHAGMATTELTQEALKSRIKLQFGATDQTDGLRSMLMRHGVRNPQAHEGTSSTELTVSGVRNRILTMLNNAIPSNGVGDELFKAFMDTVERADFWNMLFLPNPTIPLVQEQLQERRVKESVKQYVRNIIQDLHKPLSPPPSPRHR